MLNSVDVVVEHPPHNDEFYFTKMDKSTKFIREKGGRDLEKIVLNVKF